MKQIYEEPMMFVTTFENMDIVTLSGDGKEPVGNGQAGYGDIF